MNQQEVFSLTTDSARLDWPAFDKPPHYYASQNSCNVKMISQPLTSAANQSATNQRQQQQQQQQQQHNSIQRKLFGLLYIYAILIVSLYLTYAAYYYLQQQHHHLNQTSRQTKRPAAQELRGGDLLQAADEAITNQPEVESKLETKLHLLERYMELIAMDLQETKEKLKEREKCDCSMSCHFNGTRYEDRSSWQNQCDICTCQMGKISCQPKKCPPLECDDVIVTLPGQCCPTCMRQCKYNKQLIRHGQKFNPAADSRQHHQSNKVCQCLDGRIKCEPVAASSSSRGSNNLVQATLNQQQAKRATVATAAAAGIK